MARWTPPKLEKISDDTQKVFDHLNEGTDLACVLVGASYLDELLANALMESFTNKGDTARRILDPQGGALGSFAIRANLAYCLGLIKKEVHQDLISIAEIRNRFAHIYLGCSFQDSNTIESCKKLTSWHPLPQEVVEGLPGEKNLEQQGMAARNKFTVSTVMLGSRIHLDTLSRKQVSAQNSARPQA